MYPPGEDSYLLLQAVEVNPGERFLEVGTGSGLVALHVARVVRAVATDANPAAVRLARRNATSNGLTLEVLRCDLMSALRGPFDVIAFNPPYLAGSPTDDLDRAWLGGDAGSEVALRFLADLPRVLAPRGRAYVLLSKANAPARSFAESAFRVEVRASRPLFSERIEVCLLREPRANGPIRVPRPPS